MTKRKMRKLSKVFCVVFAVLLAFPVGAFAKTIDEIKAEQEILGNEKAALSTKLSALREEEDNLVEYQKTLNEMINVTKTRVDTANQSILDLNASILELQLSLEQSALEYSDTMALLKERIKAVYKAGDVTTLEVLLNSSSLYDFTARSAALQVVANYDKKLMEEISEYIDATKVDRETLKAEKEKVSELKIQLEKDQDELDALFAENELLLAEIREMSGELEDSMAELDAANADLDAQIAAIIAEEKRKQEEAEAAAKEEAEKEQAEKEEAEKEEANGGSGENTDKDETPAPKPPTASVDFSPCWPLPGYGVDKITSYWGDGRGHKGIDIGAPYGTPIVASEQGKVIAVFYDSGWGNNVLLYHNGTYSTRYAHMTSFNCSVGDYVSEGQVIGYVGSTGNSSGPHLHYEIYQNGVRIDPAGFIL